MASERGTSHEDIASSTASVTSNPSASPDPVSTLKLVEHIQELVAIGPAGTQEGIGHSTFRRVTGHHVTQSQILKELDRLKRHVRQSSTSSLPNASKSGHSPESDDEDSIDGDPEDNSRELELLKTDIEDIKREREAWIEDAERRIDQANEEKTDAIVSLDRTNASLAELQKHCSVLEQSLSKARSEHGTVLKQRDKALSEARKATADVQQQLEARSIELKAGQKDLEEQNRSTKAEIEVLHARLQDAEILRSQHAEVAEAEVSKLKESLAGTAVRLAEETQRQKASATRTAELRDQLQSESRQGKEARERLEHQNRHYLEQIETLKEQMSRRDNDIARLTGELEQLTVSNKDSLEQLSRSQQQLQELQSEAAKAWEERKRMEEALESKIAELTAALAEQKHVLEHNISVTTRDHVTELEALRKDHKEQLAEAQRSSMSEKEALERDFKDKLNQLGNASSDDVQRQLEALRSANQQDLSKVENERDEVKRNLGDQLAGLKQELQDAQQKAQDHHQSASTAHEKALADAEATRIQEKAEMADVQSRAMRKARDDAEATRMNLQRHISDAQQKTDATHKQAEETLASTVTRIRAEHESEKSRLVDNHEGHIRSLRKGMDERLADVEAENQSQVQHLLDKHDAAMKSQQDEHETHRSQAVQNFQEAAAEHQHAARRHKEKIKSFESTHGSGLQILREQHAEQMNRIVAAHEDAMQQQQQAQIRLRDSLVADKQQSLAEVETSLQKLRDHHSQVSEEIELRHEAELTRLQSLISGLEHKCAQLQTTMDSRGHEIAELQRKIKASEDDYSQRTRDMEAEVARRNNERTQKSEVKADESRVELERLRANLVTEQQRFQEELTEATKRNHQILEVGEEQHSQEVEVAKQKAANLTLERDELLGHVEALSAKVTQLTVELDGLKHDGRDHMHNTVESLQRQLSPTRVENAQLVGLRSDSSAHDAKPRHEQSRPATAPTMAVAPRSFDQYLQEAQAELSELGKVISQNEAAFAAKIAQHVGDLQAAKEQLSQDYKQKLDALIRDRQATETRATEQQLVQLHQAKQDLTARVAEPISASSSHISHASAASAGRPKTADAVTAAFQPALSSSQCRPRRDNLRLRSEESRLEAEHRAVLAKRKTEIALSHAADFALLEDDYDAALVALLGDRDALGSRLDLAPEQFEERLSLIEGKGAQLEQARSHRRAASGVSSNGVKSHESSQLGLDETAPATGGTSRNPEGPEERAQIAPLARVSSKRHGRKDSGIVAAQQQQGNSLARRQAYARQSSRMSTAIADVKSEQQTRSAAMPSPKGNRTGATGTANGKVDPEQDTRQWWEPAPPSSAVGNLDADPAVKRRSGLEGMLRYTARTAEPRRARHARTAAGRELAGR